MKPASKKVTLSAMVTEMSSALRDVFVKQPNAWIERARERMRDLPKTNFDLGCGFADKGQWFDAMFRFRVVLFLKPDYPNAWYNLGCCYFRAGKYPQAATALRTALKQNPANNNAKFMLASVEGDSLPPEQRPQHMPKEMISGFFTSVAQTYDISEANSRYQAGRVIHELLKPLVTIANPKLLDLGCGTGIVSRPWRQSAASIVGVDITNAMLTQANKATHAEKKLFDALHEADVIQLPADLPSADVVLLVNVVQFVGNLAGVMQQVAMRLIPQGVFVITLESYSGKGGYGLNVETGRFGHSVAYVKQVAEAAGLKLLKEAKVELYPGLPQDAVVFGKR
jgi:predicted TPR repeat methyltransferase